ncbi:unnamed protein product [Ambrosiozyma monospora]|uniref:Unnamed protein product n=1 Tax=Ambrosiozyma monospora TaxID=43982 RepID=A0ACB5U3G6_AMBMO|nr:unnamed protein product [Ambrosiozyma monospora]
MPTLLTLIPPKPYRKYICVPILYTILYFATTYPIDSQKHTYGNLFNGVFILLYWYTLDVFVVTEYPELRNYHVAIGETQEFVISHYTKPSFAKWRWCAQRTFFNIRGIGWNWEIKGLPPPVYKTRLGWLLDAIFIQGGLKSLIFDIFFNIWAATKFIKMDGWNDPELVASGKEPELCLYSGPLWKQMVLAFAAAYVIYFNLHIMHVASCFPWVLFGLCPVEECSPAFGSFNGVFTVKSLWGNFWHKLIY